MSTLPLDVALVVDGECVDVRAEVPEPWASAMVKAGMTHPRSGAPSMTRLAEAVGVHTSTISSMIRGVRDTDSDTVAKVAGQLRVDPVKVFEWVGRERTVSKPFEPHPDADLLDEAEQNAVNELIRLLTRDRKQGGGSGGDTAATNDDELTARRVKAPTTPVSSTGIAAWDDED